MLDPYDLNNIVGMMEVRNNLVTNTSDIFPTILLKQPPNGGQEKISLTIYDNFHNLIRSLYEGSYADFGRYIRWNLKDNFGMSVGSGVYNVIYEYEGNVEYRKILIIR